MITSAQIRAARSLLGWSQKDLAASASITEPSLSGIENGRARSNSTTFKAVIDALQLGGIIFLGRHGITTVDASFKSFCGTVGVIKFYDELYEKLKLKGGIVRIIGSEERRFIEVVGEEYAYAHAKRVLDLPVEVRFITHRKPDEIILPHVQYRYLPQAYEVPSSCYIYDNEVSHIVLGSDVQIICINHATIAKAMAIQFDLMWDKVEA
jgi:transcriptional regulator with XRE-family HTH domain